MREGLSARNSASGTVSGAQEEKRERVPVALFPALKNLGVLYQNAGYRNKAIEMWERCLANAPDDATRDAIKKILVAVL